MPDTSPKPTRSPYFFVVRYRSFQAFGVSGESLTVKQGVRAFAVGNIIEYLNLNNPLAAAFGDRLAYGIIILLSLGMFFEALTFLIMVW